MSVRAHLNRAMGVAELAPRGVTEVEHEERGGGMRDRAEIDGAVHDVAVVEAVS